MTSKISPCLHEKMTNHLSVKCISIVIFTNEYKDFYMQARVSPLSGAHWLFTIFGNLSQFSWMDLC